ncbi:DUF721 domain-containing protein [Marinoscillum sp. MHG1-6]|uniref:DUF721 domain-containing protein n=1 Tax=Marinoscillum sp. MHG1-6 TaxID=2959627 RepID=UPI0021589F65|nr:DUF721 domain-containing protein [Marinoscillum sp. MHG1-6]
MSKDNTHSFSSAFQQFLKSENLEHTFKEKRLIQSWEKIMGQTIASRTSKVQVRNKILYLQLTSAPLKQEMLNSKQKVLDLIEKEIGPGVVEDVRFF